MMGRQASHNRTQIIQRKQIDDEVENRNELSILVMGRLSYSDP